MEAHTRSFAEIDVCPRCQGAFLDPGEGVAVHGAGAEPRFLLEDGRARRKGPSELRCPAHGAAGAAGARVDAGAPRMDVYVVGDGEDAVEIDSCRACGGFFLDAGEGVALLELARCAEEVLESRTGASFVAPAPDRHAAAVGALREEKGRGLFGELVKGLLHGSRGYLRHRRRHGDLHCDYPRLFDDWR